MILDQRHTRMHAQYVESFSDWMNNNVRPDALATINLASARRTTRSETSYLSQLTRVAEIALYGQRSVRRSTAPDSRMLWVGHREVADELIHYHFLVKFPWMRTSRGEPCPGFYSIEERCHLLERGLVVASLKMPEAFDRPRSRGSAGKNFDVRPFEGSHGHAAYILKQMRDGDSELIILPPVSRRSKQGHSAQMHRTKKFLVPDP